MENIKKLTRFDYAEEYIGSSDVATLIVVGMNPKQVQPTDEPIVTLPMHFGGDGAYHAYVVDERADVPAWYTLEARLSSWIKIYDDENLVYTAHAPEIELYRAGQRGVLIRMIGITVPTMDELRGV